MFSIESRLLHTHSIKTHNRIKIMDKNGVQLAKLLRDNTSDTVLAEVKRNFYYQYHDEIAFNLIENAFYRIQELFKGGYPGYQACNTDYHDLEHTEEVFLAASRIIDGYNMQHDFPIEYAVRTLIGALFHDTGYIQEEWDTEGTGAKYTATHVDRSIEFLENNHVAFGIDPADIQSTGRIIKSTEFSMDFNEIPYDSDIERTAGEILGSADLMGQMANRAYLEKLLFLYYEFREAGFPGYETEYDILEKTIGFYDITNRRLEDSFHGTGSFCRYHFRERHGVDTDMYDDAIKKQISYLHRIIEDHTTNFRTKLKRGDWIHSSGLSGTVSGH